MKSNVSQNFVCTNQISACPGWSTAEFYEGSSGRLGIGLIASKVLLGGACSGQIRSTPPKGVVAAYLGWEFASQEPSKNSTPRAREAMNTAFPGFVPECIHTHLFGFPAPFSWSHKPHEPPASKDK